MLKNYFGIQVSTLCKVAPTPEPPRIRKKIDRGDYMGNYVGYASEDYPYGAFRTSLKRTGRIFRGLPTKVIK